MCTLYTSRVSYRGADRLDITVKSSSGPGKLLAPTWALVGGAKHVATQGEDARWVRNAPLSQERYTEGYYALLRERYRTDPTPFLELLAHERLVLCCYCAADFFCHRYLAADTLGKIAASQGIPFG